MKSNLRGSHGKRRFIAELDRSVGNLGTLYLPLASEVEGQSCRTDPLTHGVWLTLGSVRIA